MKLRTALPVATTLLLAALPSHGAIANGSSGNGELFLNVFDATAKASYAYDIGIRMDDFFISGQPDGGTQRFWALGDALFSTFLSLVNADALQWSVLAIDSTGSTAPGLQRLFTTIKQGDEAKVASQTNANFTNGIGASQGGRLFDTVNSPNLQLAGQSTHVVVAADQVNYDINGSSYSLTTDSGFGYYGKTGGLTPTYNGTAPYSAANAIGKSAWFYYITRSGSTGTNKVVIDEFDNGDGVNAGSGHDGYWGFIKVNDTTSPYDGKYLLSYTLEPRVWSFQAATRAQREFAASIGRTELTGGSWVERLGSVGIAAAQEHSAGWVLPLGAVAEDSTGPAAASAVPEPGSAALLLAGTAWLWHRSRARR